MSPKLERLYFDGTSMFGNRFDSTTYNSRQTAHTAITIWKATDNHIKTKHM